MSLVVSNLCCEQAALHSTTDAGRGEEFPFHLARALDSSILAKMSRGNAAFHKCRRNHQPTMTIEWIFFPAHECHRVPARPKKQLIDAALEILRCPHVFVIHASFGVVQIGARRPPPE